MAINSLFLVNTNGEVFMEKHSRCITSKNVCDYLFEQIQRASRPADVPPIITTPRQVLISVLRKGVFFVAVVERDVQPLMITEFLHRVADTIVTYLGDCTEAKIKEHYVIIYQVLEEVLDNGYPLVTEPGTLVELIAPPTVVTKIVTALTNDSNVSSELPVGSISWRPNPKVKYVQNEIFFDFIEEIDAIIDKTGAPVFAEIQGKIMCDCRLSGMPDLVLSFNNAQIMDSVGFHPCVRFKRWANERVLSFVPQDGKFKLCEYSCSCPPTMQMPINVRPTINFNEQTGRLEIVVSARNVMGTELTGVALFIPLPKHTLTVNLTASVGDFVFDQATKVLRWGIGKVNPQKPTVLSGSFFLQASPEPVTERPTITVDFRIEKMITSGIGVKRLDIYKEKYKPYKGVKYITKSGNFQIRT
eukprot:Colp12_sorted_trinity150504_noHs@26519